MQPPHAFSLKGIAMKSHAFGCALLSVIAIFVSAAAQAQNGTLTRSFVSSSGIDSNPCTVAAPCATFAHAYTMVGSTGIVAALDPGKYGPLLITSAVTINGNGWSAVTAPAGNNGITVIAPSGAAVTLIGLEIDGAGAGANGISFASGGSLAVINCYISNFKAPNNSGNGILI